MIKRQIAGWLIEFNKDATEKAYAALPLDMGCTCNTCRNYSAAIPGCPDEVRTFFEELGVDLAKPAEVYDLGFEINPGLCGGFYHIVGNYLSGNDVLQPVTKDQCPKKEVEDFKIADGYQVGFTQNIALVPEGFPRPVLQMTIYFDLPWVLNEPYDDWKNE